MKRTRVAVAAVACALGCAATAVDEKPERAMQPVAMRHVRTRAPEVELFFRGEQPFARRGPSGEEWPLGDVRKSEMVFSPDKRRFAYVRLKANAKPEATPAHVLVRNLAGDPINEFAVYRPGMPEELIWLDNHRIGYIAPPPVENAAQPKKAAPTNVYVVHDVDSGEIIAARSGLEFLWSPQHAHVAFVSGGGGKQNLVVDGQNVWPRAGTTKVKLPPVWSADGHGLAFAEDGPAGPRLVVLVEFDDAQGDLTWPIPREALSPGLKVFWAGDSKVVIGETALRPRFAADWKRLQ